MFDGFASIALHNRFPLTGKGMATRRDWLLQQLGITQWALRRPAVLQGEVAVSLPADVRLLIIAELPPADDEPFLRDVLRSLGLMPHQIYALTPDQVTMLPVETQCDSWRLGITEPLAVSGTQLYSPAFTELTQDADAKRALWQQICENEQHFFPDASRSGSRLSD